MQVLRVYHGGRDPAHRERDRALVRAGVEVTLVVPSDWPGPNDLHDDSLTIVEAGVNRPGDVNRHSFCDIELLARQLTSFRADIVDLHEEPFSAVVRQVLALRPVHPVVAYAAQNIDKRFPPPFAQWERKALGRINGIYPCSAQAASVVVGKGFRGEIEVIPLAPSPLITPGDQQPPVGGVRLLLVGRFEPNKGVLDAVHVLAGLAPTIDARLELVGSGPLDQPARDLAADLGVSDRLTIHPWLGAAELAERYATAQVLLAPSRATATWVEQFGRMVVEAQAAGAVVVGYASGSLPEVIGDDGLLVSEGDVEALTRAVRKLVEEPEVWQRLRQRGLDAARNRTWDHVAHAQIDLYERVRSCAAAAFRVTPQRRAAVERFGDPARVASGERPFALPILRDRPTLAKPLAAAIDRYGPSERVLGTERLRVVYLNHVARMSGGELALLRLIDALDGVDAHVILGEDGPLREALEGAGATVEVMELSASTRDIHRDELDRLSLVRTTAGYVRRLARRLRELDPDIVHTNSLKAGYYGSLAARVAGKPVIWHLRDRVADDYLPPRVAKLTRALLATLPTLVLANSGETFRTAGPRVRRGAVVNSPVIHDPYAPHRNLRSRRDAIETIGIVGRLSEWKGQDVFVRALAELRRDYPHVTGRIVGSAMFGEDEYEARLRSLVTELGLDDAVTFTGYVPDVEYELNQLDVLVHASRLPEPFGQVVVEGMAAGLPVIATDAGGPREVISHGENGLLVAPDDVGELVAALRRLASSARLRASLGDGGAARAKDFAPAIIAEQVRHLYLDVVSSSADA